MDFQRAASAGVKNRRATRRRRRKHFYSPQNSDKCTPTPLELGFQMFTFSNWKVSNQEMQQCFWSRSHLFDITDVSTLEAVSIIMGLTNNHASFILFLNPYHLSSSKLGLGSLFHGFFQEEHNDLPNLILIIQLLPGTPRIPERS